MNGTRVLGMVIINKDVDYLEIHLWTVFFFNLLKSFV